MECRIVSIGKALELLQRSEGSREVAPLVLQEVGIGRPCVCVARVVREHFLEEHLGPIEVAVHAGCDRALEGRRRWRGVDGRCQSAQHVGSKYQGVERAELLVREPGQELGRFLEAAHRVVDLRQLHRESDRARVLVQPVQ